jgi:hypothetical protein
MRDTILNLQLQIDILKSEQRIKDVRPKTPKRLTNYPDLNKGLNEWKVNPNSDQISDFEIVDRKVTYISK